MGNAILPDAVFVSLLWAIILKICPLEPSVFYHLVGIVIKCVNLLSQKEYLEPLVLTRVLNLSLFIDK